MKNFSFESQEKTNPSPQSLVPAPTCVGGFLISSGFLSGSTLKEFEQLPGHLTEALHLFSLEDMVKVKKGLLAPLLKDILKASLEPVLEGLSPEILGVALTPVLSFQIPVPRSVSGPQIHRSLDNAPR